MQTGRRPNVIHRAQVVTRSRLLILVCVIGLSGCDKRAQQTKLPLDENIVFAQKAFFNGLQSGPQIVYAAGSLTGPHVGYKNNYTAITCYQDRMECVMTTVDQIGENQIGRVGLPDFMDVTKWDKDVIVAGEQTDIAGCRHLTITILRPAETAYGNEEPTKSSNPECKKESQEIVKWTIEDPPSWKAHMNPQPQ
jgi:hypothetical protein